MNVFASYNTVVFLIFYKLKFKISLVSRSFDCIFGKNVRTIFYHDIFILTPDCVHFTN